MDVTCCSCVRTFSLVLMYLLFAQYDCVWFCVFFFFFKQKTAYEMRISDWSSDVCSSDLLKIHVRISLDCFCEAVGFAHDGELKHELLNGHGKFLLREASNGSEHLVRREKSDVLRLNETTA